MDALIITGKEGEVTISPNDADNLPAHEAAAVTATIRQAIIEGYEVKVHDGPSGEMIVRWRR